MTTEDVMALLYSNHTEQRHTTMRLSYSNHTEQRHNTMRHGGHGRMALLDSKDRLM